MQPRFEAQELYALRNGIPIRWLIDTKLATVCKTSEGVFRFQCPCCHGFHTAVSCTTNLARCFHCQRSLNPIDFVMVSRRLSFVASVVFLRRCHQELNLCPTGRIPEGLPAGQPVAAGEILRLIALSATERQR